MLHSRQNLLWIALLRIALLWSVLSTSACTIESDSIVEAEGGDSGVEAPVFGDTGNGAPTAEPRGAEFSSVDAPAVGDDLGGVVDYDGCDVDLTCTSDCEEDLDCATLDGDGFTPSGANTGGDGDAGGVPAPVDPGENPSLSFESDADEPMTIELGPLTQHWLELGEITEDQYVLGRLVAGTAILAVYDEEGRLVSRSTQHSAVHILVGDHPWNAHLRLSAGEQGVTIELVRATH